MIKENLEKYIEQGLSSYKISVLECKSPTVVRYWLKKYGLTTGLHKGENKECVICGKETLQGRKLCGRCDVKMRRLRQKLAVIEYKGGRCIKCGYNELLGLELHHRDKDDKDFWITGVVRGWKKIKKEADKCDLLCSNCHRKEHTSNEKLYRYAINYKGDNKELREIFSHVAQQVEQSPDKA